MVHCLKLGLNSTAPFISRCVFAITHPICRYLLEHAFLSGKSPIAILEQERLCGLLLSNFPAV